MTPFSDAACCSGDGFSYRNSGGACSNCTGNKYVWVMGRGGGGSGDRCVNYKPECNLGVGILRYDITGSVIVGLELKFPGMNRAWWMHPRL